MVLKSLKIRFIQEHSFKAFLVSIRFITKFQNMGKSWGYLRKSDLKKLWSFPTRIFDIHNVAVFFDRTIFSFPFFSKKFAFRIWPSNWTIFLIWPKKFLESNEKPLYGLFMMKYFFSYFVNRINFLKVFFPPGKKILFINDSTG